MMVLSQVIMPGRCYCAAQQCVYPSVVEDFSTYPKGFISYGILVPSVWKQPHSGLLVE